MLLYKGYNILKRLLVMHGWTCIHVYTCMVRFTILCDTYKVKCTRTLIADERQYEIVPFIIDDVMCINYDITVKTISPPHCLLLRGTLVWAVCCVT